MSHDEARGMRRHEPRLQFLKNFQLVPRGAASVVLQAEDGAGLELSTGCFELRRFCELLAAGATRNELAEGARVRGKQAQAELDTLLDLFVQQGLIGVRPEPPPSWPAKLCERFERQIAYFRQFENAEVSRYDYFQRLRCARVCLLGVGGLGSWALQHLVATGIGHITGVDMDHVSESNLARQSFYRSSDVGRSKVEAASEIVAQMSEWVSFRGVHERLSSRASVAALLESEGPFDLVVLTADEPIWEISVFTSEAARDARVPLLRGNSRGVGPLAVFGQSACPACDWQRVCAQIPDAEMLVGYYRSSTAGHAKKAAFSPHIAISGALLAHEAVTYLARAGQQQALNAMLVQDRHTHSVQRVPFARSPGCSVCGTLGDVV